MVSYCPEYALHVMSYPGFYCPNKKRIKYPEYALRVMSYPGCSEINKIKFFLFFWNFGQCSLDFNKLVIKAKMHAKTFFFWCMKKIQYEFLVLRHLAVCTKKHFFFYLFLYSWKSKIGYFNTEFVFLWCKVLPDINHNDIKTTWKNYKWNKYFFDFLFFEWAGWTVPYEQ